VGVIFGLPGLMILLLVSVSLHTPADWAKAGTLGLSFFSPAILLIVWTVRGTIEADEQDLRWRDLGRWRVAAWSEISDYYEQPVQTSSTASTSRVPQMTVETGAGKLRFGAGWSNVSALKELVEQNATSARAKAWGVLHERPEDLPHVFHYDTAINRNTLPVLRRLHNYTLAAVLISFVIAWAKTHTWPTWHWFLTPIGLFVLAKSIVLLALQPTYAETRRRLNQRITVQPDRLIWEDGDRRIDAPWEDVSKYFVSGMRYVVVTKQGSFDFLATLRELELLQKLIRRYAVHAPRPKPTQNASAPLWPYGGAIPNDLVTRPAKAGQLDGRTYNYRTSNFAAAIGAVFVLLSVVGSITGASIFSSLVSGVRPASGEIVCGLVALACLLCLIGFCAQYFASTLTLDEAGLTQRALFVRRFIAWEQVQDFYESGSFDLTFGNVIGPYTRIRFWNAIADADELKAEIARRAVNSRRREWGRRTSPRLRHPSPFGNGEGPVT